MGLPHFFIHNLPLANRGRNECLRDGTPFRYFRRSIDENIGFDRHIRERGIERRGTAVARLIRFGDDKEIVIAVGTRLSPRDCRTR